MTKSSAIKLIFGDCLEKMRTLPSKSVDLILCDLPYGITQNKWDCVIPLDSLWLEYLRIANGAIVLTASQPFASALVLSQPKLFRHEWIWIKNRGSNFANTVREPMKEHESVLVFSRGRWTYNKQMQERTGSGISKIGKKVWRGGQRAGLGKFKHLGYTAEVSVLRVPSSWQKFNTEVGYHPTQKPIALMEYLIRTYSNENDIVLDNTMGSGTTGVAAINCNRRFIGIEKRKSYFNIAQKRIGCAYKSRVKRITPNIRKLNLPATG